MCYTLLIEEEFVREILEYSVSNSARNIIIYFQVYFVLSKVYDGLVKQLFCLKE